MSRYSFGGGADKLRKPDHHILKVGTKKIFRANRKFTI